MILYDDIGNKDHHRSNNYIVKMILFLLRSVPLLHLVPS